MKKKEINHIYFAVIKLTAKKISYSEKKYLVFNDENGVKHIKKVKCWNGIHDIPFKGTKINHAWANEFPSGVIESKMWCDKKGLKTAKTILSNTLDTFMIDWKTKEIDDLNNLQLKLNSMWNSVNRSPKHLLGGINI